MRATRALMLFVPLLLIPAACTQRADLASTSSAHSTLREPSTETVGDVVVLGVPDGIGAVGTSAS